MHCPLKLNWFFILIYLFVINFRTSFFFVALQTGESLGVYSHFCPMSPVLYNVHIVSHSHICKILEHFIQSSCSRTTSLFAFIYCSFQNFLWHTLFILHSRWSSHCILWALINLTITSCFKISFVSWLCFILHQSFSITGP